MTSFHDFFINPELKDRAEELGWSGESIGAAVKVLEADDWGELKQKIQENREDYDILAFRGGDHELNRKAFSTPEMDVVLHPEKGRKDPGMNHIDAERASENNVAVGFTLKNIPEDGKRQSQTLSKWRRNLKLCEKYDTPYIITTEAEKRSDIRKPRDLAAVIKSLGGKELKSVKKFPGEMLEENRKAENSKTGKAGVELVE
jgi:ribonuclease P/MRP protein subunit RPP1